MSNKASSIGKKVKSQRSRMYMDNMYELFNLPLFELLKLRRKYLRYMKERRKEYEWVAREIRRRNNIEKV